MGLRNKLLKCKYLVEHLVIHLNKIIYTKRIKGVIYYLCLPSTALFINNLYRRYSMQYILPQGIMNYYGNIDSKLILIFYYPSIELRNLSRSLSYVPFRFLGQQTFSNIFLCFKNSFRNYATLLADLDRKNFVYKNIVSFIPHQGKVLEKIV